MEGLLHTVVGVLPGSMRGYATEARVRLLAEFIRFGTVGLAGLAVDTACVYGLRERIGLYGAGMVSYAAASSVTWALNRAWTYRGRGHAPAHRQWGLFLLVNLAGLVLNRGTYALLVTFVPLCAQQPVLATAAGAVAGMGVNFTLNRRLVFR